MARIEISMEEYNSLRGKIKELEFKLVEMDKQIQYYKDYLNNTRNIVENAMEEPLFKRMFSWKKIKEKVYHSL